jgi:hypothetical protein
VLRGNVCWILFAGFFILCLGLTLFLLCVKSAESLVFDAHLSKEGRRIKTVREWTPHSEMLDARDSGACVAIDLQVYAIGGFNGESELNSVEMCRADPLAQTNATWVWAPSLRKRRGNLGAAVVGGSTIFAVGGHHG